MKTPLKLTFVLLVFVMLYVGQSAQASSFALNLGTGAPPATLGSYTMTAFGPDGQPQFTNVSGVASPLGGTVGFTPSLEHLQVGVGWATWSHGYTGDVYWNQGQGSVTLTLPANTGAFYFYAEPDAFGTETITAIDNNGTTLTENISGNAGASGFGFYTNMGSLLSITISDISSGDFAIGEFGIASVPEPFSTLWLALPFAGIILFRRFRRV